MTNPFCSPRDSQVHIPWSLDYSPSKCISSHSFCSVTWEGTRQGKVCLWYSISRRTRRTGFVVVMYSHIKNTVEHVFNLALISSLSKSTLFTALVSANRRHDPKVSNENHSLTVLNTYKVLTKRKLISKYKNVQWLPCFYPILSNRGNKREEWTGREKVNKMLN